MPDTPHQVLIRRYIDGANSDLFVFSGPIRRETVEPFVDSVYGKMPRKPNCSLFLTTWGGDPDAAYKLARCLRSSYAKLRLLVSGPCKSAGTLIAVGAHELAFGPTGELGPLDVQLAKPDELLPMSSGLDVFQALSIVTTRAFENFEEFLVSITKASGGNISTKTASEIASRFSTALWNPIAAQIDPLRLGEVQRAISVAKAYGNRLGLTNLKAGALDRMVEEYPSHSFVIDADEAATLFKNVTKLTDVESELQEVFKAIVKAPRANEPHGMDVADVLPVEDKGKNEAETRGVATDHPPARPGAARADGEQDERGVGEGGGADPTRPDRLAGTARGTH